MEHFGTYEGERNNRGQFHGYGKFIWRTNKDVYEGQWYKGKQHGIGTMHYATFQYVYHGEWNLGARHGFGTMTLANGDQLTGTFINNEFEGEGVIYYHNGDFYEGDVIKGLRHGEGTLRYFNGEYYEGQWYNNQRHGFGRQTQPDGTQYYYGNWRNDQPMGIGKLCQVVETGVLATLEGNFHNGSLYGKGILADTTGNLYKGDFRDNHIHGVGELYLSNGQKYIGEFQYDDFKKGKAEMPDRTVTYGTFYHFDPDGGNVKINYGNGDIYEGGMKQGMKHGFGRLKATDGAVFVGNFHDDSKEGEARIVYPDGSEYVADYTAGIEKEPGILIKPTPKDKKKK